MVNKLPMPAKPPIIPQTSGPLLVVIGDSMLEKATPQLTSALREKNSALQVVNLSVGGSALSYNEPKDWLKAAPLIAETMKRGDKVLINLSHNDFYAMGKRHGWDNSFLNKNEYMDKATYLKNFEQLVNTFKDKGIDVHVAGPAPYLKQEPVVSKFLAKHYTAATQRIPVLSQELDKLSKKLGVNYIPMLDNQALHDKNSRLGDGLHPNDAGKRMMATQIAASITNPPQPKITIAQKSNAFRHQG